jgi:exportin-2 (importin alpha re-exporter)
MRVCSTAQDEIIPVSANVTNSLVVILSRVYQNPTNPSFNHYLFETLASIAKTINERNPEGALVLEELLFAPFAKILEMDVQGKFQVLQNLI